MAYIYTCKHAHMCNEFSQIDHIHEIIGFSKKEYPGIKEMILEIKNMKAKI